MRRHAAARRELFAHATVRECAMTIEELVAARDEEASAALPPADLRLLGPDKRSIDQ